MTNILIVDDDPSHLKIYSWIVEKGGFRAVPVLPIGDNVELPQSEPIDIALLDYRLGDALTAADVAQQVKVVFPSAAIVVLSDMMYMPDDVAPYASIFVRKGQPELLLETLTSLAAKTKQQAASPSNPAA
jgi:DNA-binding NtrC family response regulator